MQITRSLTKFIALPLLVLACGSDGDADAGDQSASTDTGNGTGTADTSTDTGTGDTSGGGDGSSTTAGGSGATVTDDGGSGNTMDTNSDSGGSGTTGTTGDGGAATNTGGAGNVGAGGDDTMATGGADNSGEGGASAGGADTGGAGAGNGGSGGSDDTPVNLGSCNAPEPVVAPGNECTGSGPEGLTATLWSDELNSPTFLTSPPGDMSRIFVTERGGGVRVFVDGELEAAPFLEVDVQNGFGEQGLLGLAFEPGFDTSGRVWINYIEARGGVDWTVVATVEPSAENPNVADMDTLTTQIEFRQPSVNHNGGMLAFGADGCLYMSFGDGGSGNDPWGSGQSLTDHDYDGDLLSAFLGKIVRIDPYNYPDPAPGNPDLGGDPHLWDYGLRNPWRFSFDRSTGDLYIGDVGQDAWEEVDVEPRGVGGHNYGWNEMEGLHCRGDRGDGGNCTREGMRLPVAEYENPSGNNTSRSVIGGYVYRGSAVPQMEGRYIFAEYNQLQFWTFVYSGEGDDGAEICDEYEVTDQLSVGSSNMTSFGEDAAGELYIIKENGEIYKLESE